MTVTAVCAALVATTAVTAPAHAAEAGANRHSSGLILLNAENVHSIIPEALRDAVGVYDLLAEANPDDFGYAYASGGSVVVDVTTDAGAARLDAMRQGKALDTPAHDPMGKAAQAIADSQASVAGMPVVARRVSASRTVIERFKHELADVAYADPALAPAGIWQTEVQRDTGRVVVRLVKLTEAAAARIVELYGTEQVAVVEQANPDGNDDVGRLDDGWPFYGGARINAPAGSCTDAFSWNISSGVHGMLTAGHCAPNGGSVSTLHEYLGSITSGSRENYSSSGTVFLPGQTVYRGDMALAQVTSGKTSAARIYRGVYNSTWSVSVRSMWSRRAQRGDQYCTGGSYSGEICGWKVDFVSIDRYISGKWKRNIVVSYYRQGWCTRGGDSGGAVYTVNSDGNVAAKGIHNATYGGGSDAYGGALDPCSEVFTDIWDAYYGFPGTLKTQ